MPKDGSSQTPQANQDRKTPKVRTYSHNGAKGWQIYLLLFMVMFEIDSSHYPALTVAAAQEAGVAGGGQARQGTPGQTGADIPAQFPGQIFILVYGER